MAVFLAWEWGAVSLGFKSNRSFGGCGMLADFTRCYRYQGQVNHFAKFAKEKIPCASPLFCILHT